MNSAQALVTKFQKQVDEVFTLVSKLNEQAKLIQSLRSKEKTTNNQLLIEKAELRVAELNKKKNLVQKVCMKVAQHDELIQLDPLNTERLVVALFKGKYYDDLKMVLQIILDKQTTILLTFSELGAIFDLSLKDESLKFEYSFID